jgi:hypothetical protein
VSLNENAFVMDYSIDRKSMKDSDLKFFNNPDVYCVGIENDYSISYFTKESKNKFVRSDFYPSSIAQAVAARLIIEKLSLSLKLEERDRKFVLIFSGENSIEIVPQEYPRKPI